MNQFGDTRKSVPIAPYTPPMYARIAEGHIALPGNSVYDASPKLTELTAAQRLRDSHKPGVAVAQTIEIEPVRLVATEPLAQELVESTTRLEFGDPGRQLPAGHIALRAPQSPISE